MPGKQATPETPPPSQLHRDIRFAVHCMVCFICELRRLRPPGPALIVPRPTCHCTRADPPLPLPLPLPRRAGRPVAPRRRLHPPTLHMLLRRRRSGRAMHARSRMRCARPPMHPPLFECLCTHLVFLAFPPPPPTHPLPDPTHFCPRRRSFHSQNRNPPMWAPVRRGPCQLLTCPGTHAHPCAPCCAFPVFLRAFVVRCPNPQSSFAPADHFIGPLFSAPPAALCRLAVAPPLPCLDDVTSCCEAGEQRRQGGHVEARQGG